MSTGNRFFQYIRGERKGEVVIFDEIIQDDGLIFVQFKDKSRCNEELIVPLNERTIQPSHIMAEVSDASNVWKFEEEWAGKTDEVKAKNADGQVVIVTPADPGKKKIKIVPPNKVNSNFGRINQIVETPKPKVEAPPPKPMDPVYTMMDAAKKFPTLVGIELEILLPKKTLFEVANDSFENGGKKVIEYIIENLDISKLKDALKNSLYEAYNTSSGKLIEAPVEKIELENKQEIDFIPTTDLEPEAIEEPIVGAPESVKEEDILVESK